MYAFNHLLSAQPLAALPQCLTTTTQELCTLACASSEITTTAALQTSARAESQGRVTHSEKSCIRSQTPPIGQSL